MSEGMWLARDDLDNMQIFFEGKVGKLKLRLFSGTCSPRCGAPDEHSGVQACGRICGNTPMNE
jgi:hypothetical protein